MTRHQQAESFDLLFAEERQFDLPPKWDGVPVEWTEWKLIWSTLVFHIKQQTCHRCKSTQPQETSYGYRDTTPYCLVVHRCPDCKHDMVYQAETDEMWDLDDSDYGPEGSTS